MGLAVTVAGKPMAARDGRLLAVGDNPARQVADQALLDSLYVVGSCVGAAPEASVDAVDDVAASDLRRNNLAARFDGVDGLGRERHVC